MAVLKENHKFRSYELDAFGRNIKVKENNSFSHEVNMYSVLVPQYDFGHYIELSSEFWSLGCLS